MTYGCLTTNARSCSDSEMLQELLIFREYLLFTYQLTTSIESVTVRMILHSADDSHYSDVVYYDSHYPDVVYYVILKDFN